MPLAKHAVSRSFNQTAKYIKYRGKSLGMELQSIVKVSTDCWETMI